MNAYRAIVPHNFSKRSRVVANVLALQLFEADPTAEYLSCVSFDSGCICC